MSTNLPRSSGVVLAAICGVLTLTPVLEAGNTRDYPEAGTVMSATVNHGYVYEIETSDRVYKMLCLPVEIFHFTTRPCNLSGRPIAVRDTVRFRQAGDFAHMPGKGKREERLMILSAELKVLPPLPGLPAGESGAVLGLGAEIHGSRTGVSSSPFPAPGSGPATATSTSPVIASGPVTAIPVTGGPPVLVIPTGPVSGGVVTGVPVSGGAPITAISTGPVTGTPVGGSSAPANTGPVTIGGGPAWIRFVRIQTAGRIYDLACPSNSCSLKDRMIQLGDLMSIRIQNKYAYLSWLAPLGTSERKFEILDVRNLDEPPTVPPH